MTPVAVDVVLAVNRSLCRNFHPCIFDCATYSCLTVSVDPKNGFVLQRDFVLTVCSPMKTGH